MSFDIRLISPAPRRASRGLSHSPAGVPSLAGVASPAGVYLAGKKHHPPAQNEFLKTRHILQFLPLRFLKI
jgi:hypothetical protein